MRQYLHPLARVLMAAIFLMSGVGKIFAFNDTAKMMGGAGFPAPQLFLVGAIVLEVFGGLSLLLGYKTRWGALALIVFLIPATIIFHAMQIGGPQGQMEIGNTIKNLALIGGLLKFYLDGAGAYALDNKHSRRL